MKPIILDLCGGSGAWSHPYRESGQYDVRLVTLPEHDVLTYIPPRGVHGILAAPPCTQFSFALNEKIPRDLDKGMETVHACHRIINVAGKDGTLAWWALENPVGHLRKKIGPPAFTFQPWQFGDPWTKRTDIWGRFTAPAITHRTWESVEKNPALYIRPGRGKPNMIWLHKSARESIPSYAPFLCDTDAGFRALTPQGFAKAFFEVNR